MSVSNERKIISYPKPFIYKKVKDMAKNQETTVSKVVQEALEKFFSDKK